MQDLLFKVVIDTLYIHFKLHKNVIVAGNSSRVASFSKRVQSMFTDGH